MLNLYSNLSPQVSICSSTVRWEHSVVEILDGIHCSRFLKSSDRVYTSLDAYTKYYTSSGMNFNRRVSPNHYPIQVVTVHNEYPMKWLELTEKTYQVPMNFTHGQSPMKPITHA